MKLIPITEDLVRRMARIFGERSAAAKAVEDYEKRKSKVPFQIGFYLSDDQHIVVGPVPASEH